MAILDLTGNLPDVQRTMHLFLTVQAAVTPTRVLPAPEKLHSKTRILQEVLSLPSSILLLLMIENCKEIFVLQGVWDLALIKPGNHSRLAFVIAAEIQQKRFERSRKTACSGRASSTL
jgi:hypothetical protein